MSSIKNSHATMLSAFLPGVQEQIADELDDCIRDATRGDRQAIGCIAIALGGFLYDEAKAALGPRYGQGAADVVQDFYLGLVEGRYTFPQIKGCAMPWMRRMIRSLAAQQAHDMGHRGPEPDEAG